ncbi:hypothetical protein pdam_00001558 [Pocillopora damicornis]|uniref:Uncharacterized protein n=1 Tax=Pocillopora damicornis TaxID=46731 RepID=A0A3M6U515_POCDA|nr:hypothetical protein pdam_00001558 [Pocillopora damicornis]
MDQAQHIIDYPPAVWNFKETWKQIVHYDARSLNAIERDGAVGKGEGAESKRGPYPSQTYQLRLCQPIIIYVMGGWTSAPKTVGSDANYYNRAYWKLHKQ